MNETVPDFRQRFYIGGQIFRMLTKACVCVCMRVCMRVCTVSVLKNELQKVIQYRKTSKKRNAGAHHPNFSKDLKVRERSRGSSSAQQE